MGDRVITMQHESGAPLTSSSSIHQQTDARLAAVSSHLQDPSSSAKMSDATHTSKPHMPRAGVATDGYSKEDEATATCYCGAVQIAFPTKKPGLVRTFVCHCHDCRKITASMFASNFTIKDQYVKFIRGKDNLSSWGQSETIASGGRMDSHFCKTCGTLMYRISEKNPGIHVMRLGTVDDLRLHETKLRPTVEIFSKDRVDWLKPIEGMNQA